MGARHLICCLAVLLLVSGCTKKQPVETSEGNLSSGQNVTQAPTDGTGMTGAYPPGSEAQLVAEIGDRVFFGYDQYDLTPQARTTLENQSKWMKTYPNVNLMVEGHADERGTREYNLALGEKRAMAVRNYLIANGVESGRVQTISYGKERPAVLGSDETSWAQNRRGVSVVQ
ncbi:MAG: peptidoglycan-associated lipoprotein Pal [Alphaproteobacteria bacterium]|nr:MAG: peptidoglycan-associated lipoprotein Pal [Alphaproteobacteria bacterium]